MSRMMPCVALAATPAVGRSARLARAVPGSAVCAAMRAATRAAMCAAMCAATVACVERRIEITSEPSGALVRVAGREVGRTPLEIGYTFHGWYDVELELEGHEPVMTTALARTPWWENPGPDLAAELWPGRIDNVQRWHFELEPQSDAQAGSEAELVQRAADMRAELEQMIPAPPSAPRE